MASAPVISVQLLSDLHLEIDRGNGSDYEIFHIEPKADILALLGDVGTIHEPRLLSFLRLQTTQFKEVLYVLGNHEFYYMSYDDAIKRIYAFEEQLQRERANDPSMGQFRILDRKRIDISPTLTILGATLWSQLSPEDLDILQWSVTDFKRIDGFSAERFTALHHADLNWLNAEVEGIAANEPGREIVIFTHHAPTRDGTADPKFADGPTQSAFATELMEERCWGKPVKIWAFGHTHWSCDFVKGGVRVVSNQRGYSKGDKGWRPEFVLQL